MNYSDFCSLWIPYLLTIKATYIEILGADDSCLLRSPSTLLLLPPLQSPLLSPLSKHLLPTAHPFSHQTFAAHLRHPSHSTHHSISLS